MAVTRSVTDAPGALDQLPLLITPPPGPASRAHADALARVECPAFGERRRQRAPSATGSAPIVLARGSGANVFDADDNRYVDLVAGFGAAILGHGPTPAHDAAVAQAGVLAQGLGDLYPSAVKIALMERLASLHPSPNARVVLGQSGADAVTIAIKTAALATGRPGLLAFEGAYHGLSYAPLAACGFQPSFAEPFAAQLNPHVRFAPYPRTLADASASLAKVRAELADRRVGAVLVEPVLGRGGVVAPPEGFLLALEAEARAAGALLIADEIWTGLGRGGRMLCSVAAGLCPDLVCLGKGLGASFPISACIGSEEVMDAWARGGSVVHTSTHAGAPFACAAALATLDQVRDRGLSRRARDLGDELQRALVDATASMCDRVAVRGSGLLVGVEIAGAGAGPKTVKALLERGYLVSAGGRDAEVVVLSPPLVIDRDVLLSFVPALGDALAELS